MAITKRQYTRQRAQLEEQLEELQAEIAGIIEHAETARYPSLNAMHDASRDLEDGLETLEWQWATRNWTTADYAEYELVLANSD